MDAKQIKGWSDPGPSAEQRASAEAMCSGESVSSCEIWYDETDGTMGLLVVDDGLSMLGYFARDGHLIGDWSV